ncbi:helix-turn-helix domain-containing protein [Corynebacterium halotolerans]|uniref:helix-turn-helix domain-containing protein n=1 Tax=Corynebacterium halotolerans TaxID=225326 RepID=UPI003CF8EC43
MAHLKDTNGTDTAATVREALRRLNHVLDGDPQQDVVEVAVERSEETIRLPRDVAVVLREILVNAAAGKSVGVIPTHAELTTQQAADLLNVSRPHVIKLMNDGVLPGHKVGTHRRIYASDVQAYKHQRDIGGRIAADDLTALTEEMGLYE